MSEILRLAYKPRSHNAQPSIIEHKQIRQLVLQDYNNRLLKNNSSRLIQIINNKFKLSVKSIIRSSMSKDRLFINFNNYQDCLYCYNNRYSLEKDIFLKLPARPIFDSDKSKFSVVISNSNIKNKIVLYNELREYLPEGIVNIEHQGKSGKFVVSFGELKVFKVCIKILKGKELRLSNGSFITVTEMKKFATKQNLTAEHLRLQSTPRVKGKKMSRIDKIKRNKHFNFRESDSRTILTFKLLNNTKILNQDKKLKYRFIKKTKTSNKPNLYLESSAGTKQFKNIDKRIIPSNFNKKKHKAVAFSNLSKDPLWNVCA